MTGNAFKALVVEPARMVLGLWSRRDLIVQFTQRNIEIRHRGSRLGAVWALINPLSMLALYFVVFGVLYGQRFKVVAGETMYDFSLALFLSLSLFHVFSEAVSWAPGVIVANPNFVKKVVFPLEVLPVAQLGAGLFHLSICLSLVILGSLFGTAGLSWALLWLPVLIVPLVLLSLGVAWLLSAIGVFMRDIGQVTAFVVTMLLFGSAVMYPASRIAEQSAQLWAVLKYNPLLQLVDLARRTVLWHEPMAYDKLGYLYACGLVVFVAGATIFSLLRKSFAEVI